MNECSPVTRRTNTGVGAHRARCHPPPSRAPRRQSRARSRGRASILAATTCTCTHAHPRRTGDARTRVNTESWLIHGGAQVRSFLPSFGSFIHARAARFNWQLTSRARPERERDSHLLLLVHVALGSDLFFRRRRRDVDVTLDGETSRHFPRMTAVPRVTFFQWSDSRADHDDLRASATVVAFDESRFR